MQDKKSKDDVFGTQSKLPLGPGDYEVNVNFTKTKTSSVPFVSKSIDYEPDEELVAMRQLK